MGKVGGRDKLKKRTQAGSWTKVDIIGVKIVQWVSWAFLAFFVVFIIYAVIDGMVRGMI